jgi:hypothetical protein
MGRRRLVVNGRILQGRCGCGAVHYEVADEFRYAANCHCSRCRAATKPDVQAQSIDGCALVFA